MSIVFGFERNLRVFQSKRGTNFDTEDRIVTQVRLETIPKIRHKLRGIVLATNLNLGELW